MSNKKILMVVGAGASNEVDLPTGNDLKKKIAAAFNFKFELGKPRTGGDYILYEAIEQAARRDHQMDISPYIHAALRICHALPQAISIDHFIDSHKGDTKLELCGKLAIVRSVLQAERKSRLFFHPGKSKEGMNYSSLENTWFIPFMQLLTENCRAEELEERLSNIRLIVFNYDRCIEHFLYNSLQIFFGIDANRSATLIRGIEIYHPYGTVGMLPWYEQVHSIEFGGEPSPGQLINLALQIKTFSEGTDPDSSELIAMRKGMAESPIVLFLGFAFHRLNLELIRPIKNTHPDSPKIRYFGTAKGISPSDCQEIATEITGQGNPRSTRIQLRNDLTCSQLFKEYSRSLTLS